MLQRFLCWLKCHGSSRVELNLFNPSQTRRVCRICGAVHRTL
jgi:hypothetical protein